MYESNSQKDNLEAANHLQKCIKIYATLFYVQPNINKIIII